MTTTLLMFGIAAFLLAAVIYEVLTVRELKALLKRSDEVNAELAGMNERLRKWIMTVKMGRRKNAREDN